jgi:hypothetical protein
MGYSDYFKSTARSEIKSAIINHGSPSLYITISPLDHRSVLAYSFCNRDVVLDMLNLPPEVSDDRFRVKQAAENPVALAEFFHILTTAVLGILFGENHADKQGIFGRLESYYGMVEAQNRGSLHIHLVLWLHGAPPPDVLFDRLSSDEIFKSSLFAYLDSIIKTDLDDFPTTNDESSAQRVSQQPVLTPAQYFDDNNTKNLFMRRAIAEYQTHTHMATCFKNARTGGRCRMRMPCPLHAATSFDSETGEITQKRSHGMINSFNPILTSLVNSNTDVTYLFRCRSALSVIHYITMYITKSDDQVDNMYALTVASKKSLAENPMLSTVTDLTPTQMAVRALLLRIYNRAFQSSQIGANIVATLLLDLPMSYKSDQYAILMHLSQSRVS